MNTPIERYELPFGYGFYTEQSDDGDYVLFCDYETVIAARDQRISELESALAKSEERVKDAFNAGFVVGRSRQDSASGLTEFLASHPSPTTEPKGEEK